MNENFRTGILAKREWTSTSGQSNGSEPQAYFMIFDIIWESTRIWKSVLKNNFKTNIFLKEEKYNECFLYNCHLKMNALRHRLTLHFFFKKKRMLTYRKCPFNIFLGAKACMSFSILHYLMLAHTLLEPS